MFDQLTQFAEVDCSFAELDVLGEALGINLRRFPFRIDHFGTTYAERERRLAEVAISLRDRGLIRNNELSDELKQILRTFGNGKITVAGTRVVKTVEEFTLGVIDDHRAVIASQHGEMLRFRTIRPSGLAQAMVSLLPPLQAGPGTSISMAAPIKSAPATNPSWQLSTPSPSYGALDAIVRRPRLAAGYFLVMAWETSSRIKASGTLNYLDTDIGRYLAICNADSYGRLTHTYSPGDSNALTWQLTRVIDRVKLGSRRRAGFIEDY